MKKIILGLLVFFAFGLLLSKIVKKHLSADNSVKLLFSDVVSDTQIYDKNKISVFCYVTEGMEGISLRGAKNRVEKSGVHDKEGKSMVIFVRLSEKYYVANREHYDFSDRLVLVSGEFRSSGFFGESSQVFIGEHKGLDAYIIVDQIKIID